MQRQLSSPDPPLRGNDGAAGRSDSAINAGRALIWLTFAILAICCVLVMLLLGLNISFVIVPIVMVLMPSLWVAHKTVRVFDLKHLTIPGFWYISYLAMIYVPSFFVYAHGHDPYRSRFLFAVQATSLTVPLGFVAVNFVSGYRSQEIAEYYEKPLEPSPVESTISTTYALFLALALCLTALYAMQAPELAIFEIFRNPVNWATYEALRLATFVALESRLNYAYALVRGVLYPLLILVALGYYLRSRKRFWLAVLIVSVVSGLMFAAVDASKGPVSVILMSVGFFIVLYRRGNIRKRVIALWGGVLLAFPLIVLMTVLGGTSSNVFQTAVESLSHRVFVTNDTVAYNYFEIFPEQVPFLHGRSIERLAWLTGRPFFDTGQYVFVDMSGTLGKFSEGDSAGGAFFAKFYADFGIPGVLLGGLLTGVVLQGIQVYLTRRRKTILYLASYAFLFYIAFQLNGEALPSVLLGRGAIIALAFPWIVETVSRIYSSFLVLPHETAPTRA